MRLHHTNLVIERVVKHQPELLPGHVRVGVHHLEPIHVPVQRLPVGKKKQRCHNFMMVFITLQTPRPSWLSFQRQIAHSWAHRRLRHPQTFLPRRSPKLMFLYTHGLRTCYKDVWQNIKN